MWYFWSVGCRDISVYGCSGMLDCRFPVELGATKFAPRAIAFCRAVNSAAS